LIYFPYWRFKGMLFSCLPEGTQAQFLDTSYQACPSPRFPVSLGLRSQALTLGLVTGQTPGYFVTPQTELQDVMAIFSRRFNRGLPHPPLHQAHIGETVSMIYAPYYLGDGLVDAILNQPLSKEAPSPWHPEDFPGGAARTRLQFIPTLCPNCGQDLAAPRDAQVLACEACRSLWQPAGSAFTAVPCAYVPADFANPLYLPFWRIKADVNGLPLNSYADLVRLGNLPKALQDAWERLPFRFWSPAFKVRPRVFLRLIQVLSTAMPPGHLERRLPENTCLTANLPVSEAVETLHTGLAGLIRPLERMAEILPHIDIKARKALLVYLPFKDRPHELVSDTLNLAVNKNQLSLAGNL
jgi:hypothetical protein